MIPVDADQPGLRVEVAFALPQRQVIIQLRLAPESTIRDAIEASGICDRFESITVDEAHVGIFGKRQTLDHRLEEGDRVEIYRPLLCDPKQVRRERAKRRG